MLATSPTLTGTANFGKLVSTGQSLDIINISGTNPNITVSGGSGTTELGTATATNAYFTGTVAGDAVLRSSNNIYIGSSGSGNVYSKGTLNINSADGNTTSVFMESLGDVNAGWPVQMTFGKRQLRNTITTALLMC